MSKRFSVPREVKKTEKIQAEYGIEASYTDIDECLKSDAFDTVYVAVPNHLHYGFAKKALEAGKHVICEKPFTLKHAELLDLEQLALKKMWCWLRLLPINIW